MKVAYALTERGEKTYWTRIGVAYTNRDESITIKLDAVPVSGTMQVREWTPRDEQSAQDIRKRGNGTSRAAMEPVDDLPSTF
jgi:hypothetical protein